MLSVVASRVARRCRSKAFLSLDNILRAQFAVAERLFGVTFEERKDVPTYHPDVRVWEMQDSEGEIAGIFYGDFFARPGKRGGAWMSSFRPQNGLTGEIPLHTSPWGFTSSCVSAITKQPLIRTQRRWT